MKDERINILRMREAIDRALEYAEHGRQAFFDDPMVQDAVVRNLEIIDETAKRVPAALREQAPEVPWGEIAGMRDRLVQGGFGVDLALAWRVVESELPRVRSGIEPVLAVALAEGADSTGAAAGGGRVPSRPTAHIRRLALGAALVVMTVADLALLTLALIFIFGDVMLGPLGEAGALVIVALLVVLALMFALAGASCWLTVIVWRALRRTPPSAA